jgi:hypothetical protein
LPGFSGIQDFLFGDGRDGDVTLDTSVTGSAITRDMYYNNLTVPKGYSLYTNGYKVRVRNVFTLSGDEFNVGWITNRGFDGRDCDGSAAEITGTVQSYTVGAVGRTVGAGGIGGGGMFNGGIGLGNIDHVGKSASLGLSQSVMWVYEPRIYYNSLGGAGGKGGDAATGSVTAAGVPGSDFYVFAGGPGASLDSRFTGTNVGIIDACTSPSLLALYYGGTFGKLSGTGESVSTMATGTFFPYSGGGGGGGGACFHSGAVLAAVSGAGVVFAGPPRGGWGGGGGGIVYIAARTMNLYGLVDVRGGNGGDTFGKAGGGGGGGGGGVLLICSNLDTRLPSQQHFYVDGGLSGAGQTPYGSMTGSLQGSSGSVLIVRV